MTDASWGDCLEDVLREAHEAGEPYLDERELARRVLHSGRKQTGGQTPERSVSWALNNDSRDRFRRVRRGRYALAVHKADSLDTQDDKRAEDSDANRGRWDRYVEDVRRYVESGLLGSEEVDYKLDIERELREARRAVLERGENCLDLVAKAINNNLTSTYDKIILRNWFRDQPEEALGALRTIWSEQELSTPDRIRAFTRLIPDDLQRGTGTTLRWIAVLLMECGARQFPPYKVTEFNQTYERTGHPGPAPEDDEASYYEAALGLLDELIERARSAGLDRPKDRLEAQSVVFAVARGRGSAPDDVADQGPCWFVGASFGEGTEDQTDRFVREGTWEHGGAKSDLFLDQVKSIEPGNRIAIKTTYLKKRRLPFDNQGELTSTMAIKAIGVVTRNPGDGRRLLVDWERVDPHREWYFFTFIPRVWKVSRETANLPWAAEALINFAFNGAEQDYDLFLREWYPDRYEGDRSEEAERLKRPEPLDETATGDSPPTFSTTRPTSRESRSSSTTRAKSSSRGRPAPVRRTLPANSHGFLPVPTTASPSSSSTRHMRTRTSFRATDRLCRAAKPGSRSVAARYSQRQPRPETSRTSHIS